MSKDRFLDKTIRDKPVEIGKFGLPKCRWCSKEVLPPRYTFCSEKCIHEWKIRSRPEYAKALLEDRDKGVCAYCGKDCIKLKKQLKEFRKEDRLKFLRELHKNGLTEKAFDNRKRLWDMDHIVRVIDGGGSAGLDNLATLCISCHRTKTAYENSVTKKGKKHEKRSKII